MDDDRDLPASVVIRLFGGTTRLADELGVNRLSVLRWKWPRERGGCDGYIPLAKQRKIMDIAAEKGMPLTAEDVLLGRRRSAVAEVPRPRHPAPQDLIFRVAWELFGPSTGEPAAHQRERAGR